MHKALLYPRLWYKKSFVSQKNIFSPQYKMGGATSFVTSSHIIRHNTRSNKDEKRLTRPPGKPYTYTYNKQTNTSCSWYLHLLFYTNESCQINFSVI